jgi:interleukin-1 receptor-associated kinase 1
MLSFAEACTPLITYKELELATNYWSNSCILGKGGFGVVFKGIWKNTAVAVKRIEPRVTK